MRAQRSPDALTKIGTNNRLRRSVRTTLAQFGLSSADATVRLAAVKDMLRSLDEPTVGAAARAQRRRNGRRRFERAIDTGLAMARSGWIGSGRAPRGNRDAVEPARLGRPEQARVPRSRSRRTAAFVESDAAVRTAAATALRAHRLASRAIYSAIETLFFGLSLGSVLVLVAIGLAITFGVMGVINMAHGELMMLGAYTTYLVQVAMPQHLDASILVAIPAAFTVAGARGRADRTDDHPLSLRTAARDAARDVRHQPRAAAARAIDVLRAQPLGVDARRG